MKKSKKKEFDIFVWNNKIHIAFTVVLLILSVTLGILISMQNNKIGELNDRLLRAGVVEDQTKYNYEVIFLEEFIEENNIQSFSIARLYKHFQDSDFDEVILKSGYVEASRIRDCKMKGKVEVCTFEILKFNQKKGKYIDHITVEVER